MQHLRWQLYNNIYYIECFTGKYTTHKIHTKPHPGLKWRIFHILTSEDIDAFTDIRFVSLHLKCHYDENRIFPIEAILKDK